MPNIFYDLPLTGICSKERSREIYIKFVFFVKERAEKDISRRKFDIGQKLDCAASKAIIVN